MLGSFSRAGDVDNEHPTASLVVANDANLRLIGSTAFQLLKFLGLNLYVTNNGMHGWVA